MAYSADAIRLEAGSIVKIEKPVGSTGTPAKPHFFVVVEIPDSIQTGTFIRLVGVSSTVPRDSVDPAKHVAMKWLATGDPETGFTKPCFTCADFIHRLPVFDGGNFPLEVAAEFKGKYVRAKNFKRSSPPSMRGCGEKSENAGMGLELLDIQFQLEKRFRIKFRRGEFAALLRKRAEPDFTVGELHALVCRKIRRTGAGVPAGSFEGVREVLVIALAVNAEAVMPEVWMGRDLGAL